MKSDHGKKDHSPWPDFMVHGVNPAVIKPTNTVMDDEFGEYPPSFLLDYVD